MKSSRCIRWRALYSEDLARHLGTSVRTLQTAMQTVHGMKLHRYIRLKRLWLVRRQLIKALPGTNVRIAAQSNGFWHMGEFSQLYRAAFGETGLGNVRTWRADTPDNQRRGTRGA